MSVHFDKATAPAIAVGMPLMLHYVPSTLTQRMSASHRHCEYCCCAPIQVTVVEVIDEPGCVTGKSVRTKCCHGVLMPWLDAGWFSAVWLGAAEP